MGLALAADLAPEYAILIGSIAGPLAKWADKTEKEYGLKYINCTARQYKEGRLTAPFFFYALNFPSRIIYWARNYY
jgi:hypothetical protein